MFSHRAETGRAMTDRRRIANLSAEVAQLRRRNADLESIAQRGFDYLASAYDGTYPEQFEDPENRALCTLMHDLARLGFDGRNRYDLSIWAFG